MLSGTRSIYEKMLAFFNIHLVYALRLFANIEVQTCRNIRMNILFNRVYNHLAGFTSIIIQNMYSHIDEY